MINARLSLEYMYSLFYNAIDWLSPCSLYLYSSDIFFLLFDIIPTLLSFDRLMVHIFELEPLDQEKEGEEAEKPQKGKKGSKEKSDKSDKEEKKPKKDSKSKVKPTKEKKSTKPKKESKSKAPESNGTSRSRSRSASPEKKEKKVATKGRSKKEKKKGKEKWVAPPLETIRKGKYDSFTSLYDNFNLPDLVRYTKSKQMKSSGNKKIVIKRIVRYLETGELEAPLSAATATKGQKRGRKASKPSTPEKKEKAKEKSPTKKQKTDYKE